MLHRIAVLQALACGSVLAKACVVRVKCDGNDVMFPLDVFVLNAVALNAVALNAVALAHGGRV